MTPTRRRLAFVAIALVATALRVYRLGADSLWYDETVSVYLAGSGLPELLRHTAADIHPPGYYLLLRGWLLLMGYGDGRAGPGSIGLEWSAAFLSLAAGLILVAVAYAAGRRVAGRTAGLAAAALVAISPYNVWYGQEVRMYTWGALAAALATYALVRAMDGDHRRRRWWAAYAATAAAGMYLLHYFAFFLVAANICVALIVLTQRRRAAAGRWLAANGAALLLYLPWLPVAWRQAFDPPVPPWRTAPSLLSALRESVVAAALGQSAPEWALPVALLLLGVALLGLWGMRRNGAAAGLLLAGSLGATALLLLLSLVTPLYHVRYLFTYRRALLRRRGCRDRLAWTARPRHGRARLGAIRRGCRALPRRVLGRSCLPRRRPPGSGSGAGRAVEAWGRGAGECRVCLSCARHLLARRDRSAGPAWRSAATGRRCPRAPDDRACGRAARPGVGRRAV